MKWSITKSKVFSQCPRKWYYAEIVASPMARDPLRREAYLLRQLQSVYAWRGSLVDRVIERKVVPAMKYHNLPSESNVVAFSMKLMETQLKFGKERRHRTPGMTKSKAGDAYCAFFDVEYGDGLDEDVLAEAKEDITTALRNLMRSDFLRKIAKENSYIAGQRSIMFQFENATVSCTPDLLAFFPNKPPLITDWKVHSFAYLDSWLQLGVYAIALSRVKPHRDFPNGIESSLRDPTAFGIVEYQLLQDKQREHSISREDIADIEDYIFRSCTQVDNLVNGKKYKELNVNQFPTTRFPSTCSRCQFKKLCWRENSYGTY